MEKIKKFFQKISKKDSQKISQVIEKIINNEITNLDIKKLKGYKDIYRVRVSIFRIIYRKAEEDIYILEISKRNDKTYKNY